MYVWMVHMALKRARGAFFLLKTPLSGLTPVSSDTTTLTKPYFKHGLKIVRQFLRKRLFFKTQKVTATGYYGIEDPFPDVISKFRRFREDTECRLLVVKSHW